MLKCLYTTMRSSPATICLAKTLSLPLRFIFTCKMSPNFPQRKIGDDLVSAIGLGCMGFSIPSAANPHTDEDSLKVLTAAADMGINFWVTSNSYGPNEKLLGRWFKETGRRKEIFLVTKFGVIRKEGGPEVCGTPEHVKEACEASLRDLNTDYIDLYCAHRGMYVVLMSCLTVRNSNQSLSQRKAILPHFRLSYSRTALTLTVTSQTPIEKTMQAMLQLKIAGKVRYMGLSECSARTLARAHKVHPVAAIEVEFSPFSLEIESPDINVLQIARELGVKIIPYSPLGRGFLTGTIKSRSDFEENDTRKMFPRFSEENFGNNLKIVEALASIAKEKGCPPSQLTLAWVLAQGDGSSIFVRTRKSC